MACFDQEQLKTPNMDKLWAIGSFLKFLVVQEAPSPHPPVNDKIEFLKLTQSFSIK